jgi:hypothetical protein
MICMHAPLKCLPTQHSTLCLLPLCPPPPHL